MHAQSSGFPNPSAAPSVPQTESRRQVPPASRGKESKPPRTRTLVPTAGPGSPPAAQEQQQLCRGNYRIKWNNTGQGGKGVISQI